MTFIFKILFFFPFRTSGDLVFAINILYVRHPIAFYGDESFFIFLEKYISYLLRFYKALFCIYFINPWLYISLSLLKNPSYIE